VEDGVVCSDEEEKSDPKEGEGEGEGEDIAIAELAGGIGWKSR
jgi:hypothetical protein